jgi:hypothetical protein
MQKVKELDEAPNMTMDEFLRVLVGQCFENDNDTTYLNATLKAPDGGTSELEFQIRIMSIDGVKTRDEDNK